MGDVKNTYETPLSVINVYNDAYGYVNENYLLSVPSFLTINGP